MRKRPDPGTMGAGGGAVHNIMNEISKFLLRKQKSRPKAPLQFKPVIVDQAAGFDFRR
jgi:hypothetical protein